MEASARGPFAPLRIRLFRAIWTAQIASNIGTWIQNVGEKWQMAELTTSPLLVSLLETGTTLPLLLLSVAAGAIADIVDRRRLLIAALTYMMAVSLSLSLLSFLHLVTPAVLLALAVLIGAGSAFTGPAFQATMGEILPKESLAAGVALNSAGYNVSRAVGPAIGGLVVGALGPAFAFLLNAVSFLGTVLVLWSWKREPIPSDLPRERFVGAFRLGLSYTRDSGPFRVILLRGGGYVFFTGVVFSLTPSLAIHDLRLSSWAFGLLLGCFGAGAVTATFFLPSLRTRLSPGALLGAFTALTAGGLFAIAMAGRLGWPVGAGLALLACGAGWLSVLSMLNTAVQLTAPSRVKARAFGVYIATWGGSMAIGAALWGTVAERLGLPFTFAAAGASLLAFHALTFRMRVDALYPEPRSGSLTGARRRS